MPINNDSSSNIQSQYPMSDPTIGGNQKGPTLEAPNMGSTSKTGKTEKTKGTEGLVQTSLSTLEKSNQTTQLQKLNAVYPQLTSYDASLANQFDPMSKTFATAMSSLQMISQLLNSVNDSLNAVQNFSNGLINAVDTSSTNNDSVVDRSFSQTLNPASTTYNAKADAAMGGVDKAVAQAKTSGGNAWLIPSFATAFMSVMMEVTKSQRATRFMEGNIAIQASIQSFQLALNSAELTKLSAAAEANKELTQAAMAFASAGFAAVALVQTLGAMKQAKTDYKKEVANAKQELKTTKAAVSNFEENHPTASSANDLNKSNHEKLVANQTAAENRLKNIQSDKGKNEFIESRKATLSKQAEYVKEINEGLSKGVGTAYMATLTLYKGTIDSQKQIVEGQRDMLRNFIDGTVRAQQDAAANYDKILDFINNIMRSHNESMTKIMTA